MRNYRKYEVTPPSSSHGRGSASTDRKESNDRDVVDKIEELRKKARQEMMDIEALDGVSLAHYLRIKQAMSRLLSANENEMGESTYSYETVSEIEKIKDGEMRKMAENILKKWQNFTRGEPEPREIKPKRRRSVRFKDEVEGKKLENLPTTLSEEKEQTSNEHSKQVEESLRIVFPAIIQPRPVGGTKKETKKRKKRFSGTLPPILHKEEKISEAEKQGFGSDSEFSLSERLPPLKSTPVYLTSKTPPPPPPSEDEHEPDNISTDTFTITPEQAIFQSSWETEEELKCSYPQRFPQSKPNSPTPGRQPTPFPADTDTVVIRDLKAVLKMKKKDSCSKYSKDGQTVSPRACKGKPVESIKSRLDDFMRKIKNSDTEKEEFKISG